MYSEHNYIKTSLAQKNATCTVDEFRIRNLCARNEIFYEYTRMKFNTSIITQRPAQWSCLCREKSLLKIRGSETETCKVAIKTLVLSNFKPWNVFVIEKLRY